MKALEGLMLNPMVFVQALSGLEPAERPESQ